MDDNLCSNLITWLKTFPGHDHLTASKLSDGVALGTILHTIAPEYFDNQWISKIKADVGDNWRLKVSNLRKIHQGVMDYLYLTELTGQSTPQIPSPDLNKIVEHEDKIELGRLLQLILGCAINCEQKEKHIEAIMRMEEGIQALLMNAIRDLMIHPEPSPLGIPDFPPQINSLQEQLEVMSMAKEEVERRCNELDLQISVLHEDKRNLKEENEKLIERIEILESGGEIGAQGFRVKDLRKQVDKLQDELFKVESSRDEYRSRVETLDKENTEVISKNEELQKLADEARSLKDEVDALRDMSDRVEVLEGSVETYKKRLEEQNFLKRQVKILEEKNTEYMHQIMELEEEVKRSGTWRPQLDLYKKQVNDLHQKLGDEAKKTDRQIFENKKLMEKLEAVTQEKERVLQERDTLKETYEDLKLTQTVNTTSPGSKHLSDLDLDVLGIPPEIREKLRRLQHENNLLKKKARDSASESEPILQSLLNDLQERHDKLLQENRWERFSPPSPNSLFYSPRWPSVGKMWPNFDPYFMKPSFKKINHLKRNLKWASESDLLILRQPPHKNLMNIWSLNAINNKRKFSTPSDKSLTLPSPTLHKGKDNPIVIHHIHEFKMAPSPTNEDSGCCRTSPSSCEGCEDHRSSGSFGIRTPDFGNTLDSGVSEMFRCLSPAISSIVEECTTHHMSDILPAIVNQEKSPSLSSAPTILHHSHPSHNTINISYPNSSHSYCSSRVKPTGEILEAKNSKTNNAIIPTTLDFVAANSNNCQNIGSNNAISESPSKPNLSISIPINRQTSLPAKPEPPDSPTPHNSPRLPHSIHNNRLKGSKIPASVVSASYSSGLQDIPPVFSNQIENLNSVSCEEIKVRSKRYPPEVCSVSNLKNSNSTCNSKSKPYLETDLDSVICLPNRYRSDARETNIDRITNKLKSGISKARSKSLEKHKVKNSECIPQKTKVNETLFIQDEEPVSSITEDKPIIPVENFRPLGRSSYSSLKENNNKENNRRSWGFENSLLYRSLREKRFLPNQSTIKNNSENQKYYVRSYVRPNTNAATSSSEILDSSSRDSLLSDEVSNNQQNNQCVIVDFKPSKHYLESNSSVNNPLKCTCLPKDRLPNSSSCQTLQSPTSTQLSSRRENGKKPEITLITDTMFTHFVVSPKKNFADASTRTIKGKGKSESTPCISNVQSTSVPSPFHSDRNIKNEKEILAISDTDTDLELIENRLVSSGYGAPLVSSESNTSILYSDIYGNNTDMDPSVSEYCTETETEFDPRQFKISTLSSSYSRKPRRRPSRRHSDIIQTKMLDDKNVSDTEALIDISTLPAVSTGSTPKKKKKIIQVSKSKILNGGIIKVKNKTTKAVFAETFNAMFTFCTP